jgi:hypothetical protein
MGDDTTEFFIENERIMAKELNVIYARIFGLCWHFYQAAQTR